MNRRYEVQLTEKIRKRFNESELRELCFRLNIGYEDLPGSTRYDKARDLVERCDRESRLQELVVICNEMRPNEIWTEASENPEQPRTESVRTDKLPWYIRFPEWLWMLVIIGLIASGAIWAVSSGNFGIGGIIEQPTVTTEITSFIKTDTLTGAPPTIVVELPTQSEETAQEAEEEDVQPIHIIVQSGETLGTISQRYDVTVEDVMAANGLDNSNFLSVGQQLIIPIGGLPEPVAVPTETPAPGIIPTAIPTTVPPEQGEAIIEISEVVGVGELTEEAVQIINSGTRQIGLVDWTLSDESGFVYTFDQVTLFGEGAGILIHTEAGTDGPTDLYWGLESPILVSGKILSLKDADGTVVSVYTVP